MPISDNFKEYEKTLKAKVKKGYNPIKMALEKTKEEAKAGSGSGDRLPSSLDKQT